MHAADTITTPDDPALAKLVARLAQMAPDLDRIGHWPAEQLKLCADVGVFRWFLPRHWGGLEWSDADIVRGYLALSSGCLTTTFAITQQSGASGRISASGNDEAKRRILPAIASGEIFATVGISHLTTSRRHLAAPVLRATATSDGYILDGYTPWVTGALHAQYIVVGAQLENATQVLLALATDTPAVEIVPPPKLVGLSASDTGEVRLKNVHVGPEWLLFGPAENVMKLGSGGTGGLQTSTLALGLSAAALEYLEKEMRERPDLAEPTAQLRREHGELVVQLMALATGQPVCSNDQLRSRANSLVLRTTQAALAAAKGTGFVVGHPAGRWCREALFFLVWSCPQGVLSANLCELAGLD